MKQTKEQLETFYQNPDPWGYQSNSEDWKRRDILVAVCEKYGTYDTALDVGAGEGWLSQYLPAKTVYGYEISDTASSRSPSNVTRETNPSGVYDLITACGVLYVEYEAEALKELIEKHAGKIVVTINIKNLETVKLDLPILEEFDFPYRDYIEHVVVYGVPTPQPRKRAARKPKPASEEQLQPKRRGRPPKQG
jgi:hypothetical protein